MAGVALGALWYLFRPVYLTMYCRQPSGGYVQLPVPTTRQSTGTLGRQGTRRSR